MTAQFKDDVPGGKCVEAQPEGHQAIHSFGFKMTITQSMPSVTDKPLTSCYQDQEKLQSIH